MLIGCRTGYREAGRNRTTAGHEKRVTLQYFKIRSYSKNKKMTKAEARTPVRARARLINAARSKNLARQE